MKLELFLSRYKDVVGLARYTHALTKHLAQANVNFTSVEPAYPAIIEASHKLLQPFGYDVHAFFNIYPVSAKFNSGAVKHFTTQMMAILYSFQPSLKKVVLSVNDIVPYMMRNHKEQSQYHRFYERVVDERAMKNILQADRILAISAYTGQTLVNYLGCSLDKIRVAYLGVDHEIFRPVIPTDAFRKRYKISSQYRYLLYVGSVNPRKNLPRLIQAFAEVKRINPRVKLIKVGTPENPTQYALLKEQIRTARLEDDILWFDNVSNEDLISFYAIADAFVFSSLYEGFGLPPLEAMACGTPVICSNSSSLPEVVGDAAITVDPLDIDGWAAAILQVLGDETMRQELMTRGIARAAQFTWARTVQETVAVYHEVDQLY